MNETTEGEKEELGTLRDLQRRKKATGDLKGVLGIIVVVIADPR